MPVLVLGAVLFACDDEVTRSSGSSISLARLWPSGDGTVWSYDMTFRSWGDAPWSPTSVYEAP